MKKRFVVALLIVPCIFIDGLSLPIVTINWILTGNILPSLSQKLTEQEG